MMHKNLKICILFCLLGVGPAIFSTDSSIIEQIEQEFETTFNFFSYMQQQTLDVQINLMPRFFLKFNVPSQKIIKKLHKDIKIVSRKIKSLKRQKESFESLNLLKSKLSIVYNFIKKHRLQYDIVFFHQSIRDRWNVLFQAMTHGQDIALLLESVGIKQKNIDGLKQLIKQVEKDLQTIEIYEYRLHTDWIDTKLANYVLKIELIRLRNAIFFHPLYKRTKLKLSSSYPR
jgi:hypothetical protein